VSQDLNAGIHSHIAGLEKKTGQPISYWVDMVRSWNEPKHMANVKRLKEEFGIGHGHANMVVHLTKENTSLHMDESQLEDSVFKGKEHWKPLYERIVEGLQATGLELELSGKKKVLQHSYLKANCLFSSGYQGEVRSLDQRKRSGASRKSATHESGQYVFACHSCNGGGC